jgi:hypothetical protein
LVNDLLPSLPQQSDQVSVLVSKSYIHNFDLTPSSSLQDLLDLLNQKVLETFHRPHPKLLKVLQLCFLELLDLLRGQVHLDGVVTGCDRAAVPLELLQLATLLQEVEHGSK